MRWIFWIYAVGPIIPTDLHNFCDAATFKRYEHDSNMKLKECDLEELLPFPLLY